MSLNRAQLIGNLGIDPEVRFTQAGKKVVSFRLATNERWTDKNTGEKKERVEWNQIVIWNEKLADIAEQYLKKGAQVYVEGKISTRKWQHSDGSDRWSTEILLNDFDSKIQMLGASGNGGNRPPAPESPDDYGTTKDRGSPPPESGGNEFDDQVPF